MEHNQHMENKNQQVTENKEKVKTAKSLLTLISKTWIFHVKGTILNSTGIIAFWHGNMLPVWKYFANKKPTAIVSQSKDGEILSELLSGWGYSLIRGSSSKGSKEALAEIVEEAKNKLVLITPDGPRGPIREFKPGAVIAAQRSGVHLYLCRVKIRRKYNFNKSWDNFSVPLLFSKINLEIIELGKISPDASREEIDEIILKCTRILNSDLIEK